MWNSKVMTFPLGPTARESEVERDPLPVPERRAKHQEREGGMFAFRISILEAIATAFVWWGVGVLRLPPSACSCSPS